jgi:hypothetical protein
MHRGGAVIEYPVHFSVERPGRFTRLQLLIRVVAFVALGWVGLSFGTIFAFAYLALPVYAASRLAAHGDAQRYLQDDGRRVIQALRWFAAVSAWAALIAEQLPRRQPDEVLRLDIDDTAAGQPTVRSAILRVLTGLPSALALMVLCWIGAFFWLWAALSVLVTERVGSFTFNYLVGLQRWSVRLLAYQAALVDAYPPFSFSDRQSGLPEAKTTTAEEIRARG